LAPAANAHDNGPRCRDVDADLVEQFGGDACSPEHPNCFFGVLSGHHLHATTEFFSTGGATGPVLSPGWISYSGETQYHFRHGTLFMHETGLVSTSKSSSPGITSAVEVITGGDGSLAGATGTLFVGGFNNPDGSVVTQVHGRFCVPRGPHDDDDDGDDD
jgi:hypothetical protein